jgi:hypothetical protein
LVERLNSGIQGVVIAETGLKRENCYLETGTPFMETGHTVRDIVCIARVGGGGGDFYGLFCTQTHPRVQYECMRALAGPAREFSAPAGRVKLPSRARANIFAQEKQKNEEVSLESLCDCMTF